MSTEVAVYKPSRVHFVKELPEIVTSSSMVCSIRGEVFYLISRNDDGLANLVIVDFIIDCQDQPGTRGNGVRGKFSKELCDEWHGKWASECSLMTDYLSIVLNKQEAYCEWKDRILKDETKTLTTYLKSSRVATDSGGSEMRKMTPEMIGEDKRLEKKLSTAMGVDLTGAGGDVFRQLQSELTSFYRIPRRGETLEHNTLGTCVISDFDFSHDDIRVIAVTTGSRTRLEESIPISQITWSRKGYWVKEHSGWIENIGGALLWLKYPLSAAVYYYMYGIYGIPALAFQLMMNNRMIDYTGQSKNYIQRMVGDRHSKKMQYFYKLGDGSEIPVPEGNLRSWAIPTEWGRLGINYIFQLGIGYGIQKYDQVVLSIFDQSTIVMPEDVNLPLGQRRYIEADGTERDITLDSDMMTLGVETVKTIARVGGEVAGNLIGGIRKGKDWLSSKAGNILSAGTDIVQKIFYGALIIGGVLVIINITD